jgi:ABC-type sulfate transport system substrate-binding protein
MKNKRYTQYSAYELSGYIDETLDKKDLDRASANDLLTRVVGKEVSEWFDLPREAIIELTSEPAAAKYAEWNALLEAAVAYTYHAKLLSPAPAWTYKTKLLSKFNPREELTRKSEDYYCELLIETPIEFHERNIIFSRKELLHL